MKTLLLLLIPFSFIILNSNDTTDTAFQRELLIVKEPIERNNIDCEAEPGFPHPTGIHPDSTIYNVFDQFTTSYADVPGGMDTVNIVVDEMAFDSMYISIVDFNGNEYQPPILYHNGDCNSFVLPEVTLVYVNYFVLDTTNGGTGTFGSVIQSNNADNEPVLALSFKEASQRLYGKELDINWSTFSESNIEYFLITIENEIYSNTLTFSAANYLYGNSYSKTIILPKAFDDVIISISSKDYNTSRIDKHHTGTAHQQIPKPVIEFANPQPRDNAVINYVSGDQEIEYILLNIHGQTVVPRTRMHKERNVITHCLPEGLYFLSITVDGILQEKEKILLF